MKRLLVVFALIALCAGVPLAQKGTAEPGFYPFGYVMDTWTGEVTSVNEDTREFTLTYKRNDKEQTFVGVLAKGYSVRMKDGRPHEVKVSELVGKRLKAYYTAKSKKVNGAKVKTNEVFQIKFVRPDK